jgi:hypothetical protein
MGTSLFQFIFSWLIILLPFQSQKLDTFDSLADLLKEQDSRAIAAYFAPIIELEILSEENRYSKAQAELIIQNFLSKNKPSLVKVVHRLNSNLNQRFAVFSMQSAKNNYRISISMLKEDDSFYIKEIRIELEKE